MGPFIAKIRKLVQARRVHNKNARAEEAKTYIRECGLKTDLDAFAYSEAHIYDPIDIATIHRYVMAAKPTNILELGSGYSTLTICHALHLLAQKKPDHAHFFISLEGNKDWHASSLGRLPNHLKSFVDLRYSRPVMTTFNDRPCHRHEELPNFTPDFIYLDGPSANDVEGDFHGLKMQSEFGEKQTAMSCDILYYENFLRVGTRIQVDARFNNTSFLINNFQRNWHHDWDKATKISIFTLVDRSKI